ncbi:hypothetical protein MHO82_14165 [Vibrio sp. Of7-15]|uniref:hypothetical protein n=1 Tax=Vibrio sp. Of7-15 TaxID=2724879 RepID=UPI001EF273E7|nr:hypothetical protein [Vibrio sp. Of7-15]MCG7498011.1 hypothetical protein [Vibrio sp. Of7-15]
MNEDVNMKSTEASSKPTQLTWKMKVLLLCVCIITAQGAFIGWHVVQGYTPSKDVLALKSSLKSAQEQVDFNEKEIEKLQLRVVETEAKLVEVQQKKLHLQSMLDKQRELEFSLRTEIQGLLDTQTSSTREADDLRDSLNKLKRNYQRDLANQLKKEKAKVRQLQVQLKGELASAKIRHHQLNEKIAEVDEWEKQKAGFEKKYTDSAQQAEKERRIDELMSKFNQLQVDLSTVNECDKDYLYRYNEAKSVLNHIRTFIQQHEMNQEYYFFVISNDTSISAQNRTLCVES